MLEFDSDEEIFFGPVTSPELRAREKKRIDELEQTIRDFSFHTVANSESENEVSFSDVADAEKVNQEHESGRLSESVSLQNDDVNASISLCGDNSSEDKNTPKISHKKKSKCIVSTPLVKELSISADSLECQINESSDVANMTTDSLVFENGDQSINHANGDELFEDADPLATCCDNALAFDNTDFAVADGQINTLEDKQNDAECCIEVTQQSEVDSCKDAAVELTRTNIDEKPSSLSMELSNYELNITAEACDHILRSPKCDYQNNSLSEQIIEVEHTQKISGESEQKIEGVNDAIEETNMSKVLVDDLSVVANTDDIKSDSFIDSEDEKRESICASDNQKLNEVSKSYEYDYIEENGDCAGACLNVGTEVSEKGSEVSVVEVHNDSTEIETMHLSVPENTISHNECENYIDIYEIPEISPSSRKRKRDSMEESDMLDEHELTTGASSFDEELYVIQKCDIEFSGETDMIPAVQDGNEGSVLGSEINVTTFEDVSGDVISMQLCEKAVEHPDIASTNVSDSNLSMEDSGIHDSSEVQATMDIEKSDLNESNLGIVDVTEVSSRLESENHNIEISFNESSVIQVSDESQTSLKIADFDLSSELYVWGETSLTSENTSKCEELSIANIGDKAMEEPELFPESNVSSADLDMEELATSEKTVLLEETDIGSNLMTENKFLNKSGECDDSDYPLVTPDCSIISPEIVLDQKTEPHMNVDVELRNQEISNLSMDDESGIGHDMSEESLNDEVIEKESLLNDGGIALDVDLGFIVVDDIEMGLCSVQETQQQGEVFDSIVVQTLNVPSEVNEIKIPESSDSKNQLITETSNISISLEVNADTEIMADKTSIFIDSLEAEDIDKQKDEILETSVSICSHENDLSLKSVDRVEAEICENDIVYGEKDETQKVADEVIQEDHDDLKLSESRFKNSDIVIEGNISGSGETIYELDCSNATNQEIGILYESEMLNNLATEDEEIKIPVTVNESNQKPASDCEGVMSITQKLDVFNTIDVTDLIPCGNHAISESDEVECSVDEVLEVSCAGENAIIEEEEVYKKDLVQRQEVSIETKIDNEVSECLEMINCSLTNELSICLENEEMSANSVEEETKHDKQCDETAEVVKEHVVENEEDFLCKDSTLNGNSGVVVDGNLDNRIVICDDSVKTDIMDADYIPVFKKQVQNQSTFIKEDSGCEETIQVNVCDVIENIVENVVDTSFAVVTSNQCGKNQPESVNDEEKSLQKVELGDDNVAVPSFTVDDFIQKSEVNENNESVKLQDFSVEEVVENEVLKDKECVAIQEMQTDIEPNIAHKQGVDYENKVDQQVNLSELLNHPNVCASEVSESSMSEVYEKYHKNLGELFYAEHNVSKGVEDMSFTIFLQESSLNQTELVPPKFNHSTIEVKSDENKNAATLKDSSLLERSLIHDVTESNTNEVGHDLLCETLEIPIPEKGSLDRNADYFNYEKQCISNELCAMNRSVTNNESEKVTESFIETFDKLKMSDNSLCVDNTEHETKNALSINKVFSTNFIENFSLKEETLKLSKVFDYDVSEALTGCTDVKKGLETDLGSTHNLSVNDEWKAEDQSSKSENLSCISNICTVDEFSFNEENRLRKLREMSPDELKDASVFSNCLESVSNEYPDDAETLSFNREGENCKDVSDVFSDKAAALTDSNIISLSATENLEDGSIIENNVHDEKHSQIEPNEEVDKISVLHKSSLSNLDVQNKSLTETENECMQKEKVDFVVCKNEAVKFGDSILDLNESKSIGLLGTPILNYSNNESPSLFSSNVKLHEGSFNVAEMTMMLNSSCNTSRIEDEIIFKNSDINNVCESPKRVMDNIVSLLPISDVLESEICSARKLSYVTMRPSSAQRCSSRKRTVKKIIGKNDAAENWKPLHERDVISSGPMSEEVFQEVKKKLFENDEDLEDIQKETLDLGDLDNILTRMSQSPVKHPASELNPEKAVVESNLEKPVPERGIEKPVLESTGSDLIKSRSEFTGSNFEKHMAKSTVSALTKPVSESTELNLEKSIVEPDMNKLVPELAQSNLKKSVSSLIGSNLKTPVAKLNLKKGESNGLSLKKPDAKTPKNKTPGTSNKMNTLPSLSLRKKPVENAKTIKAPSSVKENIPVKKDVPRLGISKTPKDVKKTASFTPKSLNPPRSLTRQETAGLTPAKLPGFLKKPASVSKPVSKLEQKTPMAKSESKNTPFSKRNLVTPVKAVTKGSMQQNTPLKPPVTNKFGYCPAKTSSTTPALSAKVARNLTPKKYWNVQSPVGKYIQEAPAPPLIQNVRAEEKAFTMPELSNESVDSHCPDLWKGTKLDKPFLPPVKYSLKTPNKQIVKTTPVKPKSILKVQNIPVPVVTKHIGSSKVVQGCNYLTNEESILNSSRRHSQVVKTPKKYAGDMDITVLQEIDIVHSRTLMKGTKKEK